MLQEIISLRGNGTSGVVYNSQIESVRVLDDANDYPVEAVVSQNGETHRYRAQYAIVSHFLSSCSIPPLKC
jgi:phenol 2-monooxygenase